MQQRQMEIYWVVATHTNAGKTTLASELIRTLNASGVTAVGFKPFAGMRLRDGVDNLCSQAIELNRRMVFSDGAHLCQASPLTGIAHLDIVVPRQLIFKDNVRDTFLLRVGSQALNNVEVWTSQKGKGLARRPDIKYLIEKTGLPFDQAQLLDEEILPRHQIGQASTQQAFDYLRAMQPQAIVCEGAGPWLPMWQQQSLVNHVFFLTADCVYFYRDLDLSIHVEEEFSIAPDYKVLLNALRKKAVKPRVQPYWIAESIRRSQVVQSMLSALLELDANGSRD